MTEEYLYNKGPMSYPIQEYKPESSTSIHNSRSITRPSFVVDTDYPRLVQFYHPSSPICQTFQPSFIDTGRIFRSDNDGEHNQHQHYDSGSTEAATVTFHAINCAAHMDVCSSPEFAIHSVPVLLAYSKGSQKGRVIKRTDDNLLVLDDVANILGVKLHEGGNRHPLPKQLGGQSKIHIENEAVTQGLRGGISSGGTNVARFGVGMDSAGDGESYSGMGEMSEEEIEKEMMRRDTAKKMNTVIFAAHAGNHDQIVMKQNHNSLTQIRTFQDAATSFLVTLEQNIYPPVGLEEDDQQQQQHARGKALPPLSDERSDVLKDFLDLCHWTLPSSWILHGHINELRNNYSTITKHRLSLQTHLDQLDRPLLSSSSTWEWSEDCKLKPNGGISGNKANSNAGDDNDLGIDIGFNSAYQCGMWKFLHILSVGIVEQRSNVMGDRSRVSPSYAAWVVRDFVDMFLTDKETMMITKAATEVFSDRENEASNSSRDYASRTSISEEPLIWCDGCRDGILSSYDQCFYGLCTKGFNAAKVEDKRRSKILHQQSSNSDEWKKVAVWLWRIHNNDNDIKDDGMQSETISHNLHPLPWPSKSNCKECYRKGGEQGNISLSTAGDVEKSGERLSVKWNLDAVYDHLKNNYWPVGIQNRRLVVLKSEFFEGRRKQFPQTMDSKNSYIWIAAFILFVVWSWAKRRRFCRRLVNLKRKNICNSPPPFNPYNDSNPFQGQAHARQRVGKVKNGLFMHHTFLD